MVAAALAGTGAALGQSTGAKGFKAQAGLTECMEQPAEPGAELLLGMLTVAAPAFVQAGPSLEPSTSAAPGETSLTETRAQGTGLQATAPGANLAGSAGLNSTAFGSAGHLTDEAQSRPTVAPAAVFASSAVETGRAQSASTAQIGPSVRQQSDAETVTASDAAAIVPTAATSTASPAHVAGSAFPSEGPRFSGRNPTRAAARLRSPFGDNPAGCCGELHPA
jgi:hypothetical protein